MDKSIGLIAGSGQFPIIFLKKALKKGYRVYTVALENEADPSVSDYSKKTLWINIGKIGQLIKFFKKNNISKTVMMGAIKKTRAFKDVKPDLKAISIFVGMRHTHDDGILRTFADALEKEGIKMEPSTFLLPELIAPKGVWTKRKPTRVEKEDMEIGLKVAKEIGRLDVGQCVVVGEGSVLAVEAIDGTDATIKRGGRLGNGKAVVVKMCKPTQDTRFDIPAIGIRTIETMNGAGVSMLAIEAGKAVVFDRKEMIHIADQYGISIFAF